MLPPFILLYEQDSRATLKIPLLLGILLTTQQSLQETLSHTPSQHILEIWACGLSSFSTSCLELAVIFPPLLISLWKKEPLLPAPFGVDGDKSGHGSSPPSHLHIGWVTEWVSFSYEAGNWWRLPTRRKLLQKCVSSFFFSSWNNLEMLLTGVL